MKNTNRSFVLFSITAMFILPGSAFAADDTPPPAIGNDEISQKTGGWIPKLEGQQLQLVTASASINLRLGCDGKLQFDVFEQFKDAIERNISYITQNAGALAINYVVYSSPTMSSIIESLNQQLNFNLRQTWLSCSSIRQAADTRREQLVEACLAENGGDEAACATGGEIIGAADELIEDTNAALQNFAETLSVDDGEFKSVLSALSGRESSPSLVTLVDKTAEEAEDAVAEQYPAAELQSPLEAFTEFSSELMTNREPGPSGSFEQAARTKRVAGLIDERAEGYAKGLNYMVQSMAGVDLERAGTDTVKMMREHAGAALISLPNARTLNALKNYLQSDPARYQSSIAALANQMALMSVDLDNSRWKQRALELQTILPAGALPKKEDLEYAEKVSGLIDMEIEHLRKRNAWAERMNELYRSIQPD